MATRTGADTWRAEASGDRLHPRFYTDPELVEAEQRLIFERTWQLVGHVSDLPATGSYITGRAGDQPVLVVRDEQGELRAYRNVCRHRGSRLLSGSGQCKAALRCRYHGWTYKLDGTLIGVPEGLAFGEKLDKSRLRADGGAGRGAVRPGVRQPRPRRGDACLAGGRSAAAPGAATGSRRSSRSRPATGTQPANWKVVADNYLEGYHVPIAHPGLMRMSTTATTPPSCTSTGCGSRRRCATSRAPTAWSACTVSW